MAKKQAAPQVATSAGWQAGEQERRKKAKEAAHAAHKTPGGRPPSGRTIPFTVGSTPSHEHASFHTTSETAEKYKALAAPHVKGFNFFLKDGLCNAVDDIVPVEIDINGPDPEVVDDNEEEDDSDGNENGSKGANPIHREAPVAGVLKIWFGGVRIDLPSAADLNSRKMLRLTPRACREGGVSYCGAAEAEICVSITTTASSEERVFRLTRGIGRMPIMVGSDKCHLRDATPSEMVTRWGEEAGEFGGYFIINGNERCIRMLQVPRRNHPTCIKRSNWGNRGPSYTDLGVSMRCGRHCGDATTITNTVHHLSTGGCTVRFSVQRREFMVPVVVLLRCCSIGGREVTDEEIYLKLTGGRGEGGGAEASARALLLLRDAVRFGAECRNPRGALAFVGARFRAILRPSATTSDITVGRMVLDQFVMVHCASYSDKRETLLIMVRKLHHFVSGGCGVDNADSLSNQEILLPGHLINMIVKDKLEEALLGIKEGIIKEQRNAKYKGTNLESQLRSDVFWTKCVDRYGGMRAGAASEVGIGRQVATFLATGNISSRTGLDLMQAAGFTIMAERLNFWRFVSHFRSVHRGSFFMQMRTTAVRKLLPDSWGFLCPVHTPDGGPCGLLNHLSIGCEPLTHDDPCPEAIEGSASKEGTLQKVKGNKAQSKNTLAKNDGSQNSREILSGILVNLGMIPLGTADGAEGLERAGGPSAAAHLDVLVDGIPVGILPVPSAKRAAADLRELKVQGHKSVPRTLEVAYIPPPAASSRAKSADAGSVQSSMPFPGLFLSTLAARMVRPVLHLESGKVEMIGPMEQPFMTIACMPSDVREGITTHQELEPTNMLSLLSSLTPFSDMNQSPRNMYQCQMGKQTMGTPAHSLPHRTDNKMYRLHNPQAPVVQTARHGEYKMDEYPNGCNAVVAVLSYTGFDMEDAMILNKSAYERGFGHGCVYKTKLIDLKQEAKMGDTNDSDELSFSNTQPSKSHTVLAEPVEAALGADGLPFVGQRLKEGDPLYSIVNSATSKAKVTYYKDFEEAFVQNVRVMGDVLGSRASAYRTKGGAERVSITMRVPRNPLIGDKFSSRHGQKGVLSILWPHEDMPFTESGVTPDVIINPHAFPSRMTIGMLVESMAGKSGALHGFFQDATPFSFHETGDKLAVDYFGEQLQAAGYNYYGSEPLYSGVSGCIMKADLYIGIVFYQRLRHMVSDKSQVRARGTVNQLTRQPIKGRKAGGGIRFGEMERDSLLSHGSAFLLNDRLMNCSDAHLCWICSRCGDLPSPTTERSTVQSVGQSGLGAMARSKLRVYCRSPKCIEAVKREGGSDKAVQPVNLPYVYRYLTNELAAMNIKMVIEVK
eukprot:CAMPEP_0194292816 /NCGR_PEP_ID=MMETSP0169-20130528/46523_1 /TAXON_ID=218684 /ORGANISM="Corethron pennatum, Strain L29A3" /LENGTH=1342 /DNA_ID=CAMNT_0039041135 /DNA_START=42 /DNA_END=4070 /DNA_ORIENTATION=+